MNRQLKEKLISEIRFEFIRSSGPGGQNVNKVSTAVILHFNIPNSHALTDLGKNKFLATAKHKIDQNGVLTFMARRFRTQENNRRDAIDRFIKLVESSQKIPKNRVSTRPTQASREKRIQSKKKHGETKKYRYSTDYD